VLFCPAPVHGGSDTSLTIAGEELYPRKSTHKAHHIGASLATVLHKYFNVENAHGLKFKVSHTPAK
jgi:hypothetical protein